MKLEVGKKYVVRSPEWIDTKYVEIIRTDLKGKRGHTALGLAVDTDGFESAVHFRADGLQFADGAMGALDIIGEYAEPISTIFFGVLRGSILGLDDLYLSRQVAEDSAGADGKVIKLKVEEIES